MQCHEFELILEQDSEAGLPASAAPHLRDCPACAALWDDFQAIRQAGSALGADRPEPPAHLWNSLRAQLESEGLIRDTRENPVGDMPVAAPAGLFSGWFGRAPRLVLAGSYGAVLLVAALLSSYNGASSVAELSSHQSPTVVQVPLTTAGLGITLDGSVKQVMASLPARDVALTQSFEHNLAIVDHLIVVCEKSVREKPDDPMAREYLYGAYQQKAVLLATAIDRSTLEDR